MNFNFQGECHEKVFVSIPFRAVTGFEPAREVEPGNPTGCVSIPFRAVTGFERSANALINATRQVSIPFRAVTGFEPIHPDIQTLIFCVSIPFRAVTGFEQRSSRFRRGKTKQVSIPFRAVTGFEPALGKWSRDQSPKTFQSLSGLSLGLNGFWLVRVPFRKRHSFNPFQGCHWV